MSEFENLLADIEQRAENIEDAYAYARVPHLIAALRIAAQEINDFRPGNDHVDNILKKVLAALKGDAGDKGEE